MRGTILEYTCSGCNLEEILDRFLERDVTLNKLRARRLNSHADDSLMGRRCIVRLYHISGDLESQVCLLQILVTDHHADLILNHLRPVCELVLIPSGESFEALKSIQMQRPLLLLE